MNHKFWNSDKAEDIVSLVKNAETSTSINAGQPCVLAMNGTDDGLAVLLPSNAGNIKTGAFTVGVAVRRMLPGAKDEVQIYGFNRNTRVLRATRAASTDSWPSMPALTLGEALSVNTVYNVFGAAGTTAPGVGKPVAAIAESMASATTQASSVVAPNGDAALSWQQPVKTFLRFM